MMHRMSIAVLLILMALLPLGSGAGQKEAKSASPAKNPPRPRTHTRVCWPSEPGKPCGEYSQRKVFGIKPVVKLSQAEEVD